MKTTLALVLIFGSSQVAFSAQEYGNRVHNLVSEREVFESTTGHGGYGGSKTKATKKYSPTVTTTRYGTTRAPQSDEDWADIAERKRMREELEKKRAAEKKKREEEKKKKEAAEKKAAEKAEKEVPKSLASSGCTSPTNLGSLIGYSGGGDYGGFAQDAARQSIVSCKRAVDGYNKLKDQLSSITSKADKAADATAASAASLILKEVNGIVSKMESTSSAIGTSATSGLSNNFTSLFTSGVRKGVKQKLDEAIAQRDVIKLLIDTLRAEEEEEIAANQEKARNGEVQQRHASITSYNAQQVRDESARRDIAKLTRFYQICKKTSSCSMSTFKSDFSRAPAAERSSYHDDGTNNPGTGGSGGSGGRLADDLAGTISWKGR
jgi:hypothetical protein